MDKSNTCPPAPRGRADGARLGNDRLWPVLRDLRACQPAYGLKARHLATLEALVSFLKGQDHQMVFASNRTILERLNHVSPRTLQRAVGDLVAAGLVIRRDSPNRKRFALRHRGVSEATAFGLDLSPLLDRAQEIAFLAEEHRAENGRCRVLKLRLRRLVTVLSGALPQALATVLEELRSALRRKLRGDQLEALVARAESLRPDPVPDAGRAISILVEERPATEMTRADSQNDAHLHRSEKDEKDKKAVEQEDSLDEALGEPATKGPDLLRTITHACPEVSSYMLEPPRSWPELRDQSDTMAAWLGIPGHLLGRLRQALGSDRSAITIFCLLQSAGSIRKPGAYLASLVTGARAQDFDPLRWLARLSAAATRQAPSPGAC